MFALYLNWRKGDSFTPTGNCSTAFLFRTLTRPGVGGCSPMPVSCGLRETLIGEGHADHVEWEWAATDRLQQAKCLQITCEMFAENKRNVCISQAKCLRILIDPKVGKSRFLDDNMDQKQLARARGHLGRRDGISRYNIMSGDRVVSLRQGPCYLQTVLSKDKKHVFRYNTVFGHNLLIFMI